MMRVEKGAVKFILPQYPYNHFAESLKKMQVLKRFFVPPKGRAGKGSVMFAGLFLQQKVLFTTSLLAVLLLYQRKTVYLF